MAVMVSVILMSGCSAARPSAHGLDASPTVKPSPSSSTRCTARGQRAVDVYSAMLESQSRDLPTSDTAYVVDSAVLGLPAASRQGPKFTADVAQCIGLGLGRFGHVALVTSDNDVRIPVRKSSGPIGIVVKGFVVTFGQVPANRGRTQVSINTGGGFGFRGGEYCVSPAHEVKVVVVSCGSAWIS